MTWTIPPGSAGEDVLRLRQCLNDLVSIMALPAVWTGGEPSRIVDTLLDTLVGILDVAFVFARLNDFQGGPPLDVGRVAESWAATLRTREIGKALDASLGDESRNWPSATRVVIGGAHLSVAAARLGLQGNIGTVIAGSERIDFPAETERLILDVAVNQAAVGLQQARLLSEQKRVAVDLDEHVAQRTRELAAANDELQREIAERQRTEEALAASERNLKLTIDTIPAPAWSTGSDGSAEFFNQHFVDFTGLSAEEASGWGWTRAVHPDDVDTVTAIWQRILASEAPGELEGRLRRHDGAYRWFLHRANPLRDESGTIVKWYGMSTDIEDRKRAEVELRRAYDSFADAQRLSHTGSFITDLVGDDHNWSEETYRIFDFEPGTKVTVQRVRDIIHPDDQPSFGSMIARAMSGVDVTFSFRVVTARGALKHVRGVAHVIEQIEGRPMFVGALQDVTESMVAEEALNRARSELAHVARVTTLSTLTASIAHEVNQPLAGIITNAGTCLRMLDVNPANIEGARETARRTIRDGNRAAEVIARLRALFSKKEFTLEPLDLNDATREVIALSLSDLQRNRVVLQSELADNLPPVTGDRIQLQQVILNLLRNASDAMVDIHERPRVLRITTELEDGGRVRLSVRDAGTGFAPHSLDSLFDAFFTTKSSGMGIGLFVSRSIVERHQGRLWAESNDGAGATFSFSLPLQAT